MTPAAAAQSAYPTPCTHLAACAAAAAAAGWNSAAAGGVMNPITLRCMADIERVAWVRPFRLEGNVKCTLFGCIESVRGSPTANDSRPPDHGGAAAALGCWTEMLSAILKSAQANDEFIAAAKQRREHERAEQKARALLSADSESEERMLDALSCYGEIEAVAHLRVTCDGSGAASLQHQWIALRKDGLLAKKRGQSMTSMTKYRWTIQGAVAQGWDRRLPTQLAPICHSLPVRIRQTDGKQSRHQDVLENYQSKLPFSLRQQLTQCDAMVVSFVGTKVPRGACDVNPHCEHKATCKACAAECDRIGEAECNGCAFKEGCLLKDKGSPPNKVAPISRWNWRLVAVDLVFTRGFLLKSRPAVSVIQTTSLLNHLRAEQLELHELVMRGLPRLDQRSQRAYLRVFFERCRAIQEPHVKGAAFEQLASGLVALVPGWIPGTRNVHTPGNEVDIPVLVEPAFPVARYWFEQFGGKIIVECKNHEHLHERSTKITGKPGSPVKKLQSILQKNKVKLGLILNTGTISENLRREAQKLARLNSLVVLFDGEDLRQIIDNPADTEMFFKHRVSQAAMRLKP